MGGKSPGNAAIPGLEILVPVLRAEAAPNLQHTTNWEENDRCGTSHTHTSSEESYPVCINTQVQRSRTRCALTHKFRGVLPGENTHTSSEESYPVCVCVCMRSRNPSNEVAWAPVRLLRHRIDVVLAPRMSRIIFEKSVNELWWNFC